MKKIAIICAVLLFAIPVYSQQDESFSDFYKQRVKEMKDWRAKANAEFSEYLASAWEEFLVQRGKKDPIGPLPDKPTYYDPAEAVGPARMHGIPSGGEKPFSAPYLLPAIAAEYSGGNEVSVDFFGVKEVIPFDQSMKLPRVQANEQAVSEGWKYLSASDFMPTVEALEEIRDKSSLGDWALYTAIKKYTDAVYIDEYVNEKILTQMFLLCQMKYKVRVGVSGNELIILLPFTTPIYQVAYISDGDEDYYIYSYSRLNSQNPLYTFSNDFSQADRKFDLVIDRQLTVSSGFYQSKTQARWSEIMGETFTVPINLPCVKFYLDYPQSDLITYHRSAVDTELKNQVFKTIKYEVLKNNMGAKEAVAYVMNLIQKGFDYKTDVEMFGRTKPLFVEESFYYGANNCKDRVLLLSWIVKDLFGLDVVMLCYEGHVACGIEFPEEVLGDSFSYQGKKYVMCDPTYIGAPIGATMPQFRGVAPSIIPL